MRMYCAELEMTVSLVLQTSLLARADFARISTPLDGSKAVFLLQESWLKF